MGNKRLLHRLPLKAIDPLELGNSRIFLWLELGTNKCGNNCHNKELFYFPNYCKFTDDQLNHFGNDHYVCPKEYHLHNSNKISERAICIRSLEGCY